MLLGTIKQNEFELVSDIGNIPLQHSAELSILFIKEEKYESFAAIPVIGYYDGSSEKCLSMPLENDVFKLPYEAFRQDGEISIAIALSDGTETIVVGNVCLTVKKAPGGVNILPSEHEWQTVVSSYMQQYIELQINPQIQLLIDEAENQQAESNRLQVEINTAVESCGEYTFENKTLKFKQADGTYGDPILLEGQSTVFLDSVAKNVSMNTIKVLDLEEVSVQVVVDGKHMNIVTDATSVFVKNKKGIEVSLATYLDGIPKMEINEDGTVDVVWDDEIC